MQDNHKKSTQHKIEVLFDESEKEILKYGISKYNFERVILNSKLSKATAYKEFKSKEHFIRLTLKNMIEKLVPSFKELINNLSNLDLILDDLTNLKLDINDVLKKYPIADLLEHQEILSYLNLLYYDIFGKIIIEKIEDLQHKNEIRDDIQPEFILEYMTSVTKGMSKLLLEYGFEETIATYKKLMKDSLIRRN